MWLANNHGMWSSYHGPIFPNAKARRILSADSSITKPRTQKQRLGRLRVDACFSVESVGLPVDGVDFFVAGVTREQERIVRADARPFCIWPPKPANSGKVNDPLQLAIGNAHAIKGGIFREDAVEINILAIVRPTWIADGHSHEFRPTLRRQVV